nr:hypothetical protein [Tanacetum cinerariifolium]
ACQDLVDHITPPGYFSELCHLYNDDFLKQYNINLARQVAMGSHLRLRFEQEAKLLKKTWQRVGKPAGTVFRSPSEQRSSVSASVHSPSLGRRWMIGHGLRLAIMKYDESTKMRQVFADVVLAGLPRWIRKLRPSSSQLKIPMYPEVRDPTDPWACKEEILLADAIVANVSRAEKKKKCRVVCRTYGVGFAHHARSDGVPVSVPTVSLQGLAILLTDAATQTEISEDGASLRLLRSSSLPTMHN